MTKAGSKSQPKLETKRSSSKSPAIKRSSSSKKQTSPKLKKTSSSSKPIQSVDVKLEHVFPEQQTKNEDEVMKQESPSPEFGNIDNSMFDFD